MQYSALFLSVGLLHFQRRRLSMIEGEVSESPLNHFAVALAVLCRPTWKGRQAARNAETIPGILPSKRWLPPDLRHGTERGFLIVRLCSAFVRDSKCSLVVRYLLL